MLGRCSLWLRVSNMEIFKSAEQTVGEPDLKVNRETYGTVLIKIILLNRSYERKSTLKKSLLCYIFRLNFSTAWSTNAVSICQSAGLTNVTRVELSRRFLIKVRTHTHRKIYAYIYTFLFLSRLYFLGLMWTVSASAQDRAECEWNQWRCKEADWVSVWQHDGVHLSTPHHLLHCGNRTSGGVRRGHPGEGSLSLGER